ncbi:MAG: YfiM family protein [Vicinamibacteria bacterium]|nr:YfiM family protein [Vicinamibacteria bacterium]
MTGEQAVALVPAETTRLNDASTPLTPRRARRWQRSLVIFGPSVTVTAYGLVAWNWGSSSTWRWSHEREWGRHSDSGGSDKFGHAFLCYAISRNSAATLRRLGARPARALQSAGLAALLLGASIEMGDAYSDKYGFSWGDLAADGTGVGLGLLLEAVPQLDGLLGASAEYFPSPGLRQSRDSAFTHFTTDNSGWRYMLNIKPAGLRSLGVRVPAPLRYVTCDVGFYIQGYTGYERSLGRADRRFLFVGASLNLPEILRDLRHRRPRFLSTTLPTILSYYHVPAGVRASRPLDP